MPYLLKSRDLETLRGPPRLGGRDQLGQQVGQDLPGPLVVVDGDAAVAVRAEQPDISVIDELVAAAAGLRPVGAPGVDHLGDVAAGAACGPVVVGECPAVRRRHLFGGGRGAVVVAFENADLGEPFVDLGHGQRAAGFELRGDQDRCLAVAGALVVVAAGQPHHPREIEHVVDRHVVPGGDVFDQPAPAFQQRPRLGDVTAGDLPVADRPVGVQSMTRVDDDRRPGAEDDSDLGDDGERDVAASAAARFEVQIAHQRGQPGDVGFLAAALAFPRGSAGGVDAKECVDRVGQFGRGGDRVGWPQDRGVGCAVGVPVDE